MLRILILSLLMTLTFTLNAQQTATFKSDRGSNPIPNLSEPPQIHQWQDTEAQPRQFIQQPPLIPHAIDGYVINQKFNKCLTCHSWANYKESGATKISLTHFSDREGHDLANVAARRYFCVQCHIPQTNAKPMVGNSFKPVWANPESNSAVPRD